MDSGFVNKAELTIPEFGSSKPIVLSMTYIKEAERRIIEAKTVNPSSYSDLEYTFNEGYREAKKNVTAIGYEITKAEKALRDAKSRAILDEYPSFLKERDLKDNATVRDAFLERQPDYVSAQDRIDMLKAMLDLMEGKIKVFENVCRFIRKEIDLVIRSGIDTNKYIR
jgi:uncharacterized membrane protein YheB (UPF0754 family)